MFRNYSLLSYGRVYNPYNWYYNPSYVVNRIYYIISGTAFYKNNIPLKPGYMYVFRASPDFKVHQEADDPVDHVFFDFSTYKGLCGKGGAEHRQEKTACEDYRGNESRLL